MTTDAANGGDGGSAPTTSSSATPSILATPSEVTVHPLVLLSVVDHHTRVARDTRKRVVGVLLGEVGSGGRVDVTNSFAVPFEEDERDPSIWFFDHSYAEAMLGMFRKVNARERVVGWYSTGPRLRPNDLAIHSLLGKFCPRPVLIVCKATGVAPPSSSPAPSSAAAAGDDDQQDGLPTTAYAAVDDVSEAGKGGDGKVFANVPTSVAATEAEDVGVEHLLRDVADDAAAGLRTLSGDVNALAGGLKSLRTRLVAAVDYCDAVSAGKLPANHDILRLLQDAFNALPSAPPSGPSPDPALARALSARSNDMMLAAYMGSLVRAVLALHGLVDNRETAAARRREAARKEEEERNPKKRGAKAGGKAAAEDGTADVKKK